ncbi:MAG: hypothetical protein NVS3B3_24570 [Aquirhabdus sp.]
MNKFKWKVINIECSDFKGFDAAIESGAGIAQRAVVAEATIDGELVLLP